MKYILRTSIEKVLKEKNRVYLAGNLKNSNELANFEFGDYEIGISSYKEFTSDSPHRHIFNHEYNYLLSGQMKVYIISEKKEYLFKKGDIFAIEPNMPYVTKAKEGTQVLFTKVPGGNDKELIEVDDNLKHWQGGWENNVMD